MTFMACGYTMDVRIQLDIPAGSFQHAQCRLGPSGPPEMKT
jgi:hypothetical protein